MVTMRLIHIVLGVFWVGTLLFIVLYLEPSVRAAGPDGMSVMKGIQGDRKLLTVLPIVAALTILSGLALYGRVSLGLNPDWISSPTGATLTLGAVASIVAFIIGVFIMRASTLKAGRLAARAEQAEDDTKGTLMAEVQALRLRARTSARVVASLLVIAVAAMAIARYL